MTWSFWCLAWGSRVLYRKTLDCLGKKVSLANCKWLFYNCFFYFWTAELIFLGRLVIENPIFKKYLVQLFYLIFFGSSLSPLLWWQHLVGVVQRNQPCLHVHLMCGIEVLVLVPFFLLLGGHPVGYSKCKSAFSISSAPHLLFSPPPTCVQLPKEHVAHSVLNFMSGLGSFLLCNKQLHLSSVFVLFLFLLLYLGM